MKVRFRHKCFLQTFSEHFFKEHPYTAFSGMHKWLVLPTVISADNKNEPTKYKET